MAFLGKLFGGGGQKYVPPVTTPTPTSTPATVADTSIPQSADNARQGAIAGLASTIKTSAQGTGGGQVGQKSLLGQ